MDLRQGVDVLVAALESDPGYLGDVATRARLTVSEAIAVAGELIDAGLLCGLDEEPWAPTLDGYLVVRLRKTAGPVPAEEALRRLLVREELPLDRSPSGPCPASGSPKRTS